MVNQGKNVRLVDPEKGENPADHPGPDRPGDRGGRDLLPECGASESGMRQSERWNPIRGTEKIEGLSHEVAVVTPISVRQGGLALGLMGDAGNRE